MDRPLTLLDIDKTLERDELTAPELVMPPQTYQTHLRRVAWLVRNGWRDPIELDVGVPELGYCSIWCVVDGNHRHAAAIYRGDTSILATISGSLDFAEKQLGIWITDI